MTTCPTTETLAQFLSAGLPDAEAEGVREHVAECARCQAVLDEHSDDPELRRWAATCRTLHTDTSDEPGLAPLLDQLCALATPEAFASGDTPGRTHRVP